jgi:ribosomal protein S18 acetylase RimI-like enzyme
MSVIKELIGSLLIRPAELGDLEGFLSLTRAIGEAHDVQGRDPRSDFYGYLRDMKEDRLEFLLAVVEQVIVGFSVVKFHKRLDPSRYDPTSCTIGVAVHPDFRRRGIGTALIERGLEEARKRAIETVYTSTFMDNIAMQKLAEKVGFIRYAIIERDGLQFPRYKRKV